MPKYAHLQLILSFCFVFKEQDFLQKVLPRQIVLVPQADFFNYLREKHLAFYIINLFLVHIITKRNRFIIVLLILVSSYNNRESDTEKIHVVSLRMQDISGLVSSEVKPEHYENVKCQLLQVISAATTEIQTSSKHFIK